MCTCRIVFVEGTDHQFIDDRPGRLLSCDLHRSAAVSVHITVSVVTMVTPASIDVGPG